MSEGRERLTLRHHQPRLFGAGKYVTSGAPRSGGIATVFRALEVQSGAHIALKVFRAADSADDIVHESFRREVKALSDLKHENIVRIIDSGLETATGEHFIAMEWVNQDLQNLRRGEPFESWQRYYAEVGQQVLQAIAFAHSKSVVHRDIKPSNILIADDGTAKVCDFGIAKLRRFLEPGVTLAHFASAPFSPPEPDDGSYSYSRDVFGFAALSIAMVAAPNATTHVELHRALESMEIEEPVRRVLRKSLSLENPAERPVNAAVLLAELEKVQPRTVAAKHGAIIFALTRKVKDIISYDIGLSGEDAIGHYVAADLGNAACQYTAPPQSLPHGKVAERSILIYGDRYGYVAVRDELQPGILKLVSANDPPIFELERSREGAMPFEFEVAFGGVPLTQSVGNISTLRQRLDEFSAEQKLRAIEQHRQQLFRTWLDLLSAKTDLENSRKLTYRYTDYSTSGGLLELKLGTGANTSPLEDQDIRIETEDGTFLGTVIGSQGDVIRVLPSERNRIAFSSLAASGSLSTDTARADAAFDKQRVAVDAVRYGRSVDPDLGEHIMDPSAIRPPVPAEVDFIQTRIDDDKKDAVRTAVAAPPLMLVEGPPGTGKTTFITELVLQVLRTDASARILLTSQTHVALDNSLEKITKESHGDVQAVRIGHESDERIAPTSKALLVDRKLPSMRRDAITCGREFIEKWAADRGVDLVSTRMAMTLGRHAGLHERLEAVDMEVQRIRGLGQQEREALSAEDRDELDEQFAGLIREMESIERDLKESAADFRKYEADKATVQHLSECSATELRSWAETYAPQTPEGFQLKKILAAHADWEARFGRGREFKAALIASSQVVAGTCLGVMGIPGRKDIAYDLCIVDEASIATPTEVLVPMSRARRTVLVGDNRQLSPFQDPELHSKGHLKSYGLTRKDQETTLFRHLTETLPPELHKILTLQHRMLPEIGDLISHCFYRDGLTSVHRDPDPVLATALPKAVMWKSTSRIPKRASSKAGTSHFNNLEVQLIERILTRLDFDIQHGKWKDQTRTVAVLTGYGEQKRRLQTAIDVRRQGWKSFSNIFVNVVDAFQGREADVAIFSVTRSDVSGLGFLREMERINVALSRGRERLIIVGDHSYCLQAPDAENPLKDVINYIERNSASCIIEAVQP